MSLNESNKNADIAISTNSSKILKGKKAAAGAALVVLSGIVPSPAVLPVQAATTTMSVTGSLITGITITKMADAGMGSNAATAATGSLVLSSAGAVTPSNAVAVGGGPKAGKIKFKAVSTTPNVDVTVTGLGAVTLGATTNGAAASGAVSLSKLKFKGIMATAKDLTAAGTSAKLAGVNITKTDDTMSVGFTATFSGGSPIARGAWTEVVTFTITF